MKSGKLKMLAIAAPQRSPLYPDVPTLHEAGGRELRKLLETIEVEKPPFKPAPAGALGKAAHWVQPRLVAEVRLDPAVAAVLRQRPAAGRRAPQTGVELRADLAELLLAEAAAGAPAVDEAAALVVGGEVQRAEAGATTRGLGETDHHEVVDAEAAQLQPLAAPAGTVAGVRPLRHHAFEA